MVLLKGADDEGFVFYSGYVSRKAGELEQNPRAALVFYWRTARQAGPGRRSGRAGLGSRIGRVLRNAAARQPARGVGVAAEPATGEP